MNNLESRALPRGLAAVQSPCDKVTSEWDAPLGPLVEEKDLQSLKVARLQSCVDEVQLVSLDVDVHIPDLFVNTHAPMIEREKSHSHWLYLPYGPFDSAEDMRHVYAALMAQQTATFFAVLLHGKPVGVVSYLDLSESNRAVEIGHIWCAPLHHGSGVNTAACWALMQRAFDAGYRRVAWRTHNLNARSKHAATRLGFTQEGLFQQAAMPKGRNRDTAWFSIGEEEWKGVGPTIRGYLESNGEAGSRPPLASMTRKHVLTAGLDAVEFPTSLAVEEETGEVVDPQDAKMPIGVRVEDATSRKVPEREVLQGVHFRLEPLEPARHLPPLYDEVDGNEAMSREKIDAHWAYMGYGPFDSAQDMVACFEELGKGNDPIFFAVVSQATSQPVGVLSLMRIFPASASLEIGHVWYAPSAQRTGANTEANLLLLALSFEKYGYRRVEWKCYSLNRRSRAAALRLGFKMDGLFRKHRLVRGRSRDTAWFSMLDSEWPRVKAVLQEYVAMDGETKPSLSSMMRAAGVYE